MPHDLQARLSAFTGKSDGQRRIQTFMRENPARLSAMSFDDIATATGTSQPTVTRVVRKLGYDNSLALRVAAATSQPGRLTADQLRRAAGLIRNAGDLYIYAPPVMDRYVDDIFTSVFPKTDVTSPMKPKIQKRRDRPSRTANIFDEGDAMLVLGISGLPEGYDFEALFQHAADRHVAALILQAVPFEVDYPALNMVSLGLHGSVHEALAALYLGAAVADIRGVAASLN